MQWLTSLWLEYTAAELCWVAAVILYSSLRIVIGGYFTSFECCHCKVCIVFGGQIADRGAVLKFGVAQNSAGHNSSNMWRDALCG
jgi:hypothetical protein